MPYEKLLDQAKKMSELIYRCEQSHDQDQIINFRAELLALVDENRTLKDQLNKLINSQRKYN